MREINIKKLRANLSKELNNLPFAITRNGKIIGYVQESVHKEELPLKGVHIIGKDKPLPNANSNLYEPCAKHEGSMKITCGCK